MAINTELMRRMTGAGVRGFGRPGAASSAAGAGTTTPVAIDPPTLSTPPAQPPPASNITTAEDAASTGLSQGVDSDHPLVVPENTNGTNTGSTTSTNTDGTTSTANTGNTQAAAPPDPYNLADTDVRSQGLLDTAMEGYKTQLAELNRMGNVSQMRAAGVANAAGGTALGGLAQAASTQGNIEAGGLKQDAYQKYLSTKMGIKGTNADIHNQVNTTLGNNARQDTLRATDRAEDRIDTATDRAEDRIDTDTTHANDIDIIELNNTHSLERDAFTLRGLGEDADKVILADANAAYDKGGFMRPVEVATAFSPSLTALAMSNGVGVSPEIISDRMIKYQQDTGRPMTQAQVYQWIIDTLAIDHPQEAEKWKKENKDLFGSLQSESSKKHPPNRSRGIKH